jgi:hypothetical protein
MSRRIRLLQARGLALRLKIRTSYNLKQGKAIVKSKCEKQLLIIFLA